MSDTVKIKMVIHTGYANCKHEDVLEIDREYWDSLVGTQEDFLDQCAIEFLHDKIEVSAYVEEE